eukprot:CAMPEP_0119548946 /NCGR_PEP_ID=MMETSP1352-20130426/2749_1 /TAXON_ID=265584 /ORGANISM="Stauroneis constricta, Strain CCMP1120" /LENGTH=656 /DNA_ID=CAMNT_0007594359 /DNA_START=43 /DNA_END=2010 /DNA_ORIENTATION=-
MASTSAPTHVTQSISDRKKSRELAEARQAGTVAPAVDVKSGQIINPHNPEFITKRPWYLGGGDVAGADGDAGPSLDHQADQRLDKDKIELSMSTADAEIRKQRKKFKEMQRKQKFAVGMWVEAMRSNKGPYRMCQITKISKKGTQFDLKYEDGTVERKVKFDKKKSSKLFSGDKKPRIKMVKSGSRTIQLDASVHGKETFDSKRDKYHGYDHESHTKMVEKVFNEREAIRKQMRNKEKAELAKQRSKDKASSKDEKKEKIASDSDSDLDSDVESDSDEEFVQKDEDDKVITSRLARQGGVGGAQMKVTARNLRIREDTAKYLRNLDVNSAFYDPKSRSMRDNPNPEVSPEEAQFVGDNFTRISGDAIKMAETQMFAWDAETKGIGEVHAQANPSQAELLNKKFKNKAAELKLKKKQAVLSKYGGEEYLDGTDGLADATEKGKKASTTTLAAERKTRYGVSMTPEEYNRDGRLVKGGQGKAKNIPQKSKYQEDVFINGHTTVWGSYFHVGAYAWGYADDHSLIRSSYCTGANGRKANDESNQLRYGTGAAGSAALAQAKALLKSMPKPKAGKSTLSASAPPSATMSKLYGEADESQLENLDKKKLKEALAKASKKDDDDGDDDRKRKYNSLGADADVTAEEMEAYRMKKGRSDDPMA